MFPSSIVGSARWAVSLFGCLSCYQSVLVAGCAATDRQLSVNRGCQQSGQPVVACIRPCAGLTVSCCSLCLTCQQGAQSWPSTAGTGSHSHPLSSWTTWRSALEVTVGQTCGYVALPRCSVKFHTWHHAHQRVQLPAASACNCCMHCLLVQVRFSTN